MRLALGPGLSAAPRTSLENGAKATVERRHLTAVFSDLVDSTRIAAHLDRRSGIKLQLEYHSRAMSAITRFGSTDEHLKLCYQVKDRDV